MNYPSNAVRGRGSRRDESRAWASPNLCAHVMASVLSGRRSTDDIAADVGRSKSMVNQALHALRGQGLIDFTDGKKNTIHPTVTVVANGVRDGA